MIKVKFVPCVLSVALLCVQQGVFGQETEYYYVGEQRILLQASTKYQAFKVDIRGDPTRFESLSKQVPSAAHAELSPVLAKYGIILTRKSGPQSLESVRESVRGMPEVSNIVSEPPVYEVADGDQVLINEFIIQFKEGVSEDEAQRQLERAGARVVAYPERIKGRYVVTFPELGELEALHTSNQLHENEQVMFSQPNFIRVLPARPRPGAQEAALGTVPDCPPGTDPDDPFFTCQWALNNTGMVGTVDADIDAVEAWDISTGSPEIIVAIIDEGVDTKHLDLKDKIVKPYDATDGDDNQEPQAADAHGTACAGIVAAVTRNAQGVASVAPAVKIMPVRIATGTANGGWLTTDLIIEDGIRTAVDRGAHVLSNSWGGGGPSNVINSGIQHAVNNERVVAFAAGNDYSTVSYPANLSKSSTVIAVSATNEWDEFKTPETRDGESWWGSNHGKEISVAAPGVHIYTSDISGSDGYDPTDYTPNFNGTSSATPHVAGVAALVLSNKPELSASTVRDIIQSTADDLGETGFDEFYGHGRLNAQKALKETLSNP